MLVSRHVFFGFQFVLWRDSKVHYSTGFFYFFFVSSFYVFVFWSVLWDLFVSQNPRKSVRLIFQDGFRYMQISFGSIVKFQFLAQFQVDHFPLSRVFSYMVFALACRLFLSLLGEVFTQTWADGFHWWSLNKSKCPQVSRTLLSILADVYNAVVWMVSTCPVLSNSSCSFGTTLCTVPSAHIITCFTVTFMFRSFCSSLARSRY